MWFISFLLSHISLDLKAFVYNNAEQIQATNGLALYNLPTS